jgi:hypothetical protein
MFAMIGNGELMKLECPDIVTCRSSLLLDAPM